jgi:preprotein translocase subunit SecE
MASGHWCKEGFMAKAIAVPEKDSSQQGIGRVTGLVTRTRDFLKDVRAEMRKVVTPTRAEVRSTTTVVIVAVFTFAAFFYVVDSALDQVLRALLHSLGGTQ